MNKTKYLVTGAAGFLGANLIYKLQDRKNTQIIAVVHDDCDLNLWRLKDISSSVKIIKVDLTNREQVEKLIKNNKPDYILHLATKGIYARQWNDPIDVLTNNYVMSVNLLETAKKYNKFIKGFLTLGSLFEYGIKKGMMVETEETDQNLSNLYAVSKRTTVILADWYKKYFPIIILRLSTIYGAYNDPSKFIEGVVLGLLQQKPVKVARGVVKDFLYIDDATNALTEGILKIKDLNGEIINVGSGVGYDLETVSKLISSKIAPHDLKSLLEVDEKYQRPNESMNWASIEKAFHLLNWKPKYSLEEGLDLTILWYKRNLKMY